MVAGISGDAVVCLKRDQWLEVAAKDWRCMLPAFSFNLFLTVKSAEA